MNPQAMNPQGATSKTGHPKHLHHVPGSPATTRINSAHDSARHHPEPVRVERRHPSRGAAAYHGQPGALVEENEGRRGALRKEGAKACCSRRPINGWGWERCGAGGVERPKESGSVHAHGAQIPLADDSVEGRPALWDAGSSGGIRRPA